jgi:hypothetical protein
VNKMRKKRALSSDDARRVRQQGYDDAQEFAYCIGLPSDYKNDPKAKKDVIDPSGDAHSVKGGQKKWQIFLYGINRFWEDDAFVVMAGVGDLLAECINSFPQKYAAYEKVKYKAKERLRRPMKKLAKLMSEEAHVLRAFLNKSLFNGGEVKYLTVKHDELFHVFLNTDVISAISENIEVCNSQKRAANQMPEQKVLFRYKGVNLGELEMRNDSPIHYRQVRFNMIKPKVMELLFENIPPANQYNVKVKVYGNASKHFGRW